MSDLRIINEASGKVIDAQVEYENLETLVLQLQNGEKVAHAILEFQIGGSRRSTKRIGVTSKELLELLKNRMAEARHELRTAKEEYEKLTTK